MNGADLWDRHIESYGLGVTMTKDQTIRLQAEEIGRLRCEVTKYRVRLQVMRAAWRETDFANWVSYDYPEARGWFDQNGVST